MQENSGESCGAASVGGAARRWRILGRSTEPNGLSAGTAGAGVSVESRVDAGIGENHGRK
jgi:hypothetical protein